MRLAFTTLAAPAWSVEEVCEAAVRYGYDGLEWRLADGALLGPDTPDDVWARIASASDGLGCACLDTSCVFAVSDEAKRERAVADAVVMGGHAASIGASAIRVFGGKAEVTDELVALARDAIAHVATEAAGVEVLVETHDDWSRARDAARLVEGVPGAGVLWDVAHTHRAGEDPAESLEACGSPSVVHVKDARGAELTHLGEGDVPLERVVDVLGAAGFDGWLSFEWEKLWHPDLAEPEEALPRAAEHLRALLDR